MCVMERTTGLRMGIMILCKLTSVLVRGGNIGLCIGLFIGA
jgi:hypothetical protein